MILFILFLGFFSLNHPQVSTQYLPTAKNNQVIEIKNVNLLPLNVDQLSGKSILVRELRGKTLLAKNAQEQREIASLTKLMSAYLAFFIFRHDQVFTFTPEAIDQEGKVGYFKIGQKVNRDDLIKAGLIASSNDTIYLLAQAYGLEKFVLLMNETAKNFDLKNTVFYNPTGLDTPEKNLSTAFDLSLLSEKIYSNAPVIFYWSTLERIIIKNKVLWTTNLILPKYRSIIVGGKTGFTPSAGECLLLILKLPNSPFISLVILSSQDRWQDAEKIIQALKSYYGQ
jgi:D-alanyl-D-alanine carboxypeptidase